MVAVPKVVKLVVIPLLLLVVVGAVALLIRRGGGSDGSPDALVIEALVPGEMDGTLRQGEVGIDLIAGWDASLSVNGTPIPDDELDRVVDLGQITFTPRDGKAVPYLQAGQNCATATYWQIATGPEQSFTRTWCFTAV